MNLTKNFFKSYVIKNAKVLLTPFEFLCVCKNFTKFFMPGKLITANQWITHPFFTKYLTPARGVFTNQKLKYARTPATLHINLTKQQPFFSILTPGTHTHKSYSTGVLLRLYLITAKKRRRSVGGYPLLLKFFNTYFVNVFKSCYFVVAVTGYKKRYQRFITQHVIPFAKANQGDIIFLTKTMTGNFLFRRVKAIKKRLRKKLNK